MAVLTAEKTSMPKKAWNIYIARAGRKPFIGVTNELEKVDAKILYSEKCRSRTDALKREAAIKQVSGRKQISLLKAAGASKLPQVKLPGKLYQVVNEGFVCKNCGAAVEPTEHDGPRNHCPFCLYSQHVDVQPGDRRNPCRGMLKPVGVDVSGNKGYVIIYRCEKCKETTRAKAALKSSIQPDDFDEIIRLSGKTSGE